MEHAPRLKRIYRTNDNVVNDLKEKKNSKPAIILRFSSESVFNLRSIIRERVMENRKIYAESFPEIVCT